MIRLLELRDAVPLRAAGAATSHSGAPPDDGPPYAALEDELRGQRKQMEMSAMIRKGRWDGPLWAVLLLGLLLAGALGCFGVALAVQSSPTPQADILTTDNCPPPADL